jgi:hypothetical protein
MRHGDEIQILIDGPSVRLKSLQPIGISHKSQCWGIWIDKRLRKSEVGWEKESPQCLGSGEEPLDFVISPIHPTLWPVAFRIEAAVPRDAGTLHSLSKQLVRNNVNVLYMDVAPAGYTHSSVNAICTFDGTELLKPVRCMEREISDLRRKAADLPVGERAKLRAIDVEINDHRINAMKELGEAILGQMLGLWASLRTVEHEQYRNRYKPNVDPFFLASRVVEEGLKPWYLDILRPFESKTKSEPGVKDDTSSQYLFDKILSTTFNRSPDEKNGIDPGADSDTIDEWLRRLLTVQADTFVTLDGGIKERTVQASLASTNSPPDRRSLLRRVGWRHTHLPLTVQALIRLAEMRCWMAPYDPIEFHYDADRQLLKPENARQFADQVKSLAQCGPLSHDKPVWALATYHPEDRFVRLRFLSDRNSKQRVRIRVAYWVYARSAPDTHFVDVIYRKPRTKGLIAHVTEAIYKCRGNILRVNNAVGTFDPNTGAEVGNIHFAVEFDSDSSEPLATVKAVIEKAVDSIINPQAEITTGHLSIAKSVVNVTPMKRDRVFVSTVVRHRRYSDFVKIIKRVADRHGLEVRYARSHKHGTRQNVHKEIAKCRYFLQVITPRSDDRLRMQNEPGYVPDFTWVTYELGCAVALQRHDPSRSIVQMRDELIPGNVAERLETIRGDIDPIRFRIDDNKRQLRQSFESAIRELLQD